jgi:two-component system LytT family sensor kinase
MPFLNTRSWLLYASAWLPYIASYYLIFRLQRPGDGLDLVDALANVLPAAVLGLFVFAVLQHLPWPTKRIARFALFHFLLCALYAASWLCLETLCLALVYGISRHLWRLPAWSGYALQWQAFSGVMIYVTLTGLFYMVVAQRRAQLEQQKRLEAEALRVRSELSALRSQLNPHFLFNALHSLTALISIDPRKAETAIMDLSKMLRYALASHADSAKDEVSLREELDFTEAYLSLEALRLGSRLTVERDIEIDSLDCAIPSLTVQPLVENAIKHSIAMRPRGGKLKIETREAHGTLVVRVSDDGCGEVPDLSRSNGLGLKSILRRLDLFYQRTASMEINSASPDGFTVTMTVPQGDDR